MFSNKNFKKIFTITFVIICFFGVSYKAKSITLADVELFINLGIIPTENAQRARDFLSSENIVSTGPGSIIKNPSTSAGECLLINKNLIKGKSGSLVSALQRFLKSEGHFPKGQEVTGYFGDVTVQAVSDFQLITGLIKTGNQLGAGTVGPVTQKKIQEISCAKSNQETETSVATTSNTVSGLLASSTPRQSFYSNKTSEITGEITTLKMQDQERFLDVNNGNLKLRYKVYVEPKDSVDYFEVVLLCDSVALEIKSKDIEVCGKVFVIDGIKKGKRSINIDFKNKSTFTQPIIFAVEAFNENKESIGFVEKKRELVAPKPVVRFQVNNSTVSQFGINAFQRRNCSWDERLDFIRYTMTPYNPTNVVSLPVCWPGELLCNRGNPPTFCEITGGPNSDNLCSSDQKFESGRCVAR